MRTVTTLGCALFLTCAITFAHAGEPEWGAEQDGLSCRVVTEPDYAIGQAVSVRIQIRNSSDRTRYLYNRFDKDSRALVTEIKDPSGKKLREQDGDDTPPRHRNWHPIGPGEVWDIPVPDLTSHFVHDSWTYWQGILHIEGDYELTLTYRPPKLDPKMIIGTVQEAGGKLFLDEENTPADILAAAWHGTLTAPPVTLRSVAESDLAVHEWGVFTVYNDVEFANVDRKAEWATLPDDFYRQFPKDKARLQWIPSAWDKPIIYFHTARPNLRFRANVHFSDGAPVVWWPAVAKPIDDTGGRRPPVPEVKLFRELEWHGWLGDKIPEGEFMRGSKMLATAVTPFPEQQWLEIAREVPEASTITVAGTNLTGRAPWTAARVESEKFLYYDGLVPAPDYLRCTRSDVASVTLQNTAPFDIGPLWIADQRADRPKGASVEKIGAGKILEVSLAHDNTPDKLAAELTGKLEHAGLLKSESASVLAIWKEGLFNRPGVTATYLLPRAEYDRMLPLKIEPEPKSTVRVGIVRQPNLEAEPALTARAKELIANLNAEEQKTRMEATRGLIDLGPVAIRLIKDTLKADPDPETSLLCRKILGQIDASDYLPD